MTAPLERQAEPDPSTSCAARAADLSELLAYVTGCSDDDKRQLARRLHDNMGSSLTALTMHLSLLAHQLPGEPALQERMTQMRQILGGIIDANRTLQGSLWNDKLEFLGIEATLRDLVDQFAASSGVAARLTFPDETIDCPPAHGVAIWRMVEEGLRNVLEHGHASEVDVMVDAHDDGLSVTVRDNGRGPAGAPDAGCHSLRLLRERARQLGGTLTLTANADGGASLVLTLPA